MKILLKNDKAASTFLFALILFFMIGYLWFKAQRVEQVSQEQQRLLPGGSHFMQEIFWTHAHGDMRKYLSERYVGKPEEVLISDFAAEGFRRGYRSVDHKLYLDRAADLSYGVRFNAEYVFKYAAHFNPNYKWETPCDNEGELTNVVAGMEIQIAWCRENDSEKVAWFDYPVTYIEGIMP
jgi:hypothetical protein